MTYKSKAVIFIFTFIGLAFLSSYIFFITKDKLWNHISDIFLGIGILVPALVVGGIAYISLWQDRKKAKRFTSESVKKNKEK